MRQIMPLFKRNQTPPPAPEPAPRRGLFGRSHSPPQHTTAAATHHDTAATRSSSTSSRSGGGLFGRRSMSPSRDPSIAAARQRMNEAQTAERQADSALASARLAVRDAREHVKIVEQEARAE